MARTKEDAIAANDVTDAAAPRRRGRPAKGNNNISTGAGVKKAAYVPTGRPRGRPPTGAVKKAAYVPTGKPRGRPPGKGKKAAKTANPKSPPTPKAGTGRGRGRPPKSAAVDTATPQSARSASPDTGKKRGHPSKNSLEPAATEDDDDHEEPNALSDSECK